MTLDELLHPDRAPVDRPAVGHRDPASETYGSIVARTPMPGIGDELHHYGWQTCSSAFDCCELERRYLIVPGLRSSRSTSSTWPPTRAPPASTR
jgi:methanethiol oxidase